MSSDDFAAVGPIRDPGALLATVPAILGFVPDYSSVVVGLRRDGVVTTVGPVLRQDLPDTTEQLVGSATVVADICERGGVDRAILIVVDDSAFCAEEHAPTVAVFADVLARHGCALIGAYFAPELADGADWWEIDCAAENPARWSGGAARSGRLTDPATRDLALVRLLDGNPPAADRRELEQAVRPANRSRRRAVARAIAAHPGHPSAGIARGVVAGAVAMATNAGARATGDSRQMVGGAGRSVSAIVELAVAVRDVAVRDAALGIGAGDVGDHGSNTRSIELLWLDQGRHLTGADRATALTLAGYHAYARGDGARAGIAFTAALEADPTHRLALLLDDALRIGMPPNEIRALSVVGARVSADIDAAQAHICDDRCG